MSVVIHAADYLCDYQISRAIIAQMIAKADFIAGMAKGLAVLECFDTERQRLNASVASQRAGITRAAARRHLLTLQHLGYLEGDGSYFWLAPKVLRFSGSYIASARLPRVLQPTLNHLALQTGLSFSAVVRDGDQVVIVARSVAAIAQPDQARARLAYGLHLGARLPIHATSTGQVLLAALPKPAFNAWLKQSQLHRITAHTLIDPKAFRAAIEQVRKVDYCLAHETHELGVHALAVPVRNARGETVAAINMVVSGGQTPSDSFLQERLTLLQDAASQARSLL